MEKIERDMNIIEQENLLLAEWTNESESKVQLKSL